MSDLFLLIPDAALREAVVEQVKAAKLGEPRLLDSAQDWQRQDHGETPNIIVIDDAGDAKKTEALLRVLKESPLPPVILMLGGEGDIEGVTESFAKPFRLGHLVTRLRYYVETAPLLRDSIVTFGTYRLEPHKRCLMCEGEAEPIRLTEKETALLVFLAQSEESASRRDILASVWGYDERIDTRTLETHIYQLRRKLDNHAKGWGGEKWLVNDAGGYRLARGQEK